MPQIKPGVELLTEIEGVGAPIQRQHTYLVRLNIWLNRGEPVRWAEPWGLIDRARLEDNGETLITDLRVDRESMFSGLFYGVQEMKIGGTRKLRIAPHLAYGESGILDVIPENAVLVVEISIIGERSFEA